MVKKSFGKKAFVTGLVLVAAGAAVWLFTRGGGKAKEQVPVFAVQKGPLTIAVTSGGSLQSRDKVVITSELEGNNTVIWVIQEGTNVQSGDLLLEFDASDLVDKRNEQEITVANAEANLVITTEKLGITEGDCEAALQDREVALELAKMDLEKYEQGDYPQQLRQNEADIALANEDLKRASEKLEWSQKLAKEGFLTRTELQADELSMQRCQINLEMKLTTMNVLTNYTVVKQRATYASALRTSERAVIRTKWQNKATLRQVGTEVMARTRERDRATNRLSELNIQVEKSKIYAPTNGMVLYASTVQISQRKWWIKPLEAGSTAVERQELIYIPLESGMVVEVMIPESSLNKIDVSMPARVKVDAFPGHVFNGRLAKIGILPDGQSTQLNPDLKLYKCEIECDFRDVTVRPGMSCDVELVKETYEDAMFVPVQCVVRVDGLSRVYVRDDDGDWVPRIVRVGLDNNRMIHILEGVQPGDQVMLAPPVKEQKAEEEGQQQPDKAGKNGKNGKEKKADAPDVQKPDAPEKDAAGTTEYPSKGAAEPKVMDKID